MLLDILQQAGRNLRARTQRLLHEKGDLPADQRPLNRSMRLRRHTNIHGIQLVGIQHLCDFPIPFSAVGTSHVFTLLPAAAADRLELHILHSRQQIGMHLGEPACSYNSYIKCHPLTS
ncbi:hypothetical protein D3C73_549240 [compost metagenome]